jgi:hypothetical protein
VPCDQFITPEITKVLTIHSFAGLFVLSKFKLFSASPEVMMLTYLVQQILLCIWTQECGTSDMLPRVFFISMKFVL